MRAVVGPSPCSSSGVTRYHLGAEIDGAWVLLAEIDVMDVDWCGVDGEGEAIHYWDPPREDEPYTVGVALSTLYWHGEAPSGRRAKDAPVWARFPSLWDAILGVASWYGWDLEVEGYPS